MYEGFLRCCARRTIYCKFSPVFFIGSACHCEQEDFVPFYSGKRTMTTSALDVIMLQDLHHHLSNGGFPKINLKSYKNAIDGVDKTWHLRILKNNMKQVQPTFTSRPIHCKTKSICFTGLTLLQKIPVVGCIPLLFPWTNAKMRDNSRQRHLSMIAELCPSRCQNTSHYLLLFETYEFQNIRI